MEHRDLIVLQDIIRPAYFIPEQVMVSKLMKELQERKIHMAIVIDEFGGTQGIVTMEDILEEIVGEIHDEYDEVLKDDEQSADGSVLVNASMSISKFNDKFAGRFLVDIPEAPEYETVNGFLSTLTGRIPELNEEIRYRNLSFAVMKKGTRRLRQVKVVAHPVREASAADPESGDGDKR
jgi:CBS domain containing-hemolysin-like protein